MLEAEALAGIYTFMCNQQWRPKSINFGHAKKSWNMEHEPSYRWGLIGLYRVIKKSLRT
jgi:hypothetical protein